MTMPKRALSQANRRWLADEMAHWETAGVFTAEQSGQILSLYETPTETASRSRGRALFTLMGLAAVLVAAAVLLVIGYNWQSMPAAAKLTLIFGAIVGVHAIGFHLRFTRGVGLGSEIAFFLGCLLYGCGIWQVAQIFHIQSHYPNGIWIWALGVLPFALGLRSVLLHALFVGLMGLWAGVEVLGFPNLGGWLFGRWNFVPNGAYSLPLLALPGLLWAYHRRSLATVALYVPLLAWWVVLQPFTLNWDEQSIYIIGAAGGVMLLVSALHDSPLGWPYRWWGLLLTAGALVPLTFYDFNRELAGYLYRGYGYSATPEPTLGLLAGVAILLAVTAVLAVAGHIKRRNAGPAATGEALFEMVRRQWVAVGVVLLMAALPILNAIGSAAPAWCVLATVLANAAAVVLAVWLIQLGVNENRGTLFAAGVLYFLLWIVLRYADLFGEFGGMLGAALMFFLCGAALFGVTMYWHKRKEPAHV
jgi:hypothetical protein